MAPSMRKPISVWAYYAYVFRGCSLAVLRILQHVAAHVAHVALGCSRSLCVSFSVALLCILEAIPCEVQQILQAVFRCVGDTAGDTTTGRSRSPDGRERKDVATAVATQPAISQIQPQILAQILHRSTSDPDHTDLQQLL